MSSITIKNIPDSLLEQVRERAEAERRSVNKEFIRLVETALRGERAGTLVQEQVTRQAAAWRELAGAWRSDMDAAAETRAIYAARTEGRSVNL